MLVKQFEIKIVYLLLLIIFLAFLLLPIMALILVAFKNDAGGLGLIHFLQVFAQKGFLTVISNSVKVSISTALLSTLLAFMIAYTVNMTNLPKMICQFFHFGVQFPMLLPTITYGFIVIYSFGKQGLFTQILGTQIFEGIYGFWGLLIAYVIYTLPVCYLIINNTFKYIDKKFIIVSIAMKDNALRRFYTTLFRPLLGTFGTAVIQAFCLSFADYGIPASLGGQYEVIAVKLYQQMLGSNPSFENGAVIALFMLSPSIVSLILLRYLSKFNVRFDKITTIPIKKSFVRDFLCGVTSCMIIVSVLSVFIVIFIAPFVRLWPYDLTLDTVYLFNIFKINNTFGAYKNSVLIAIMTGITGCVFSFLAAFITIRSKLKSSSKALINTFVILTNIIPGMVLGIAYLLVFSGSTLHNTLVLIVICNVIHYFSTPYLMSKETLTKINVHLENVSTLLGDSWFQCLYRVILPNCKQTLIQIFSYFFINAMVTVSAVIFIAGANNMVLTAKIKELQHFSRFEEIFLLSILIFLTNLILLLVVGRINYLSNFFKKRNN